MLLGRAYRKDCARLVVRMKPDPEQVVVMILDYDGELLHAVEGPYVSKLSMDTFSCHVGSTTWPVLLGPEELKRQVQLYHGPEVDSRLWLARKLPHKLSLHPVIPSAVSVEVLDSLLAKLTEAAEGSSEGDAKTVNCNFLVRSALLARLFSEATMLAVGMPQSDLLYGLMLRHPDLVVEDLSGYFMDGIVEAHLTGRITPSTAEQRAAMGAPPGV